MQDTFSCASVNDREGDRKQRFGLCLIRGCLDFFQGSTQLRADHSVTGTGSQVLPEPFMGRFQLGQGTDLLQVVSKNCIR